MKMSAEAKVGIFVFIGIILLVYMSLWLGGMRFAREEPMTISVSFPSAAGLDKDASVTVAGVEVGRVKDIVLADNRARLVLEIDPEVKIGSDFTALLKTKGMLGEKFVELIPGRPGAPLLSDGGTLTRTGSHTDMDRLMTILAEVATDIKSVTTTLKTVLGGEEGEASLSNIISNVEELSYNLNRMVKQNDERVGSVMSNLDSLLIELRQNSPEMMRGLREVSESLNEVIGENRENLKGSLENLMAASAKLESTMEGLSAVGRVAKKIDEGEGTIGKLVNDPETADKINKALTGINRYIEKSESFRTFVGYRAEFLFDEEDAKSYLSLRVQPRDDKYYLFEIIDDPRGKRALETMDVTTGGVMTRTTVLTTKDDLLFSAQFARRFNDVVLRGGLIESTGGFGIDYFMWDDRIKFTFDAFDFDTERNPHLKAGATVYLSKNLYVTGGYDDFVSRIGLEASYLGIGLVFEDEDLKYLFGSIPQVSF